MNQIRADSCLNIQANDIHTAFVSTPGSDETQAYEERDLSISCAKYTLLFNKDINKGVIDIAITTSVIMNGNKTEQLPMTYRMDELLDVLTDSEKI